MIYISTSCVKHKKIKVSIQELVDNGYTNIELSGGTEYYDGFENDLLELKEKYGITPGDVEKIRIGLNHITAENQLKVAETPLHAQNHPAVAVAIALVEDQVFMKEFFECYNDPVVVELGKRAEVYTDEGIDAIFPTKIGTRLEITTKDGETYMLFEEDKPPIPPEFIKEKFKVFASMTLPDDKVEAILGYVEKLETLESLVCLSKNLA